MENGIKYSLTNQTESLKKGNFWIATNDVPKPFNTDWYTSITPATGGYSIYVNKESGGPSIFSASNDSDLIYWTRQLSGQTFATGPSALNWYNSQTDKMVFNIDYPPVVTNGLMTNLDSGFSGSYPTYGTSWYNIGPSGGNASLFNTPTFSPSFGGILTFDGTDDYGTLSLPNNYPDFSVSFFFRLTGTKNYSYAFSTSTGNSLETFQIEFNDPDAGNTARTLWCWWKGTSGFDGGLYIGSTGSVGNWNDNTWRYLTFTHTGVTNTLYINGFQPSYLTAGDQNISFFGGTNCVASIGRRQETGGLFFQGNIPVVQIYNRALSSTESLQNYLAFSHRINGYSVTASGGTIAYASDGTSVYKIHIFTSDANFVLSSANPGTTFEYLLVGGGGGGGYDAAGGGGAGGFVTGSTSLSNGIYSVSIGAGGAKAIAVGAAASNGGNTAFNSITALGGGGGGSKNTNGRDGGSGGGGGHPGYIGGTGATGQGFPGGSASSNAGGGGGGASEIGKNGTTLGGGGNGGVGKSSAISGSTTFYAGGGGGGSWNGGTGGLGGTGGGGNGGMPINGSPLAFGFPGAINTGGGGGANGYAAGSTPANGGSGIAIIRYKV